MSLAGYALYLLVGIVFFELFRRLDVMPDVRRVFDVAPAAVGVVRSSTLTDDEKERAVRRMSLQVLGDTARFTAKILGIVLACVLLVAVAQWLFDLSPTGLTDLLTAWQGIVAAIVGALVYSRVRPRLSETSGTARAAKTSTTDTPARH